MRGFGVSFLALVAFVAKDSLAFLPNPLRRVVPYNRPILHATFDQPSTIAGSPVDDRVRQAYGGWCKYYGKQFDESRLTSFSSNFLQVERYFKETGQAIKLNEYADLTSEEYQLLNSGASTSFSAAPGSGSQSTVDVDDRILEAYKKWCDWHGRTFDMARLETFSSNFVKVEQYHKETGTFFKLNEFADLTTDEFELQMSSAKRILEAYTEWCDYHGKAFDKARLDIFSSNFVQVEQYHKETGTKFKLNEFADLTTDEYQNTMSSPATAVPQTSDGWGLAADAEVKQKADEESRLKAKAGIRSKEAEEISKAEFKAKRIAGKQARVNTAALNQPAKFFDHPTKYMT